MGISKSTAFSPGQNELAQVAKALAHPARIAILQAVAAQPGCVCGQLVTQLPLSQATLSQHLRELKEAGLLQGEVTGTRMCYCLAPDAALPLVSFLTQLAAQACRPAACCPAEPDSSY